MSLFDITTESTSNDSQSTQRSKSCSVFSSPTEAIQADQRHSDLYITSRAKSRIRFLFKKEDNKEASAYEMWNEFCDWYQQIEQPEPEVETDMLLLIAQALFEGDASNSKLVCHVVKRLTDINQTFFYVYPAYRLIDRKNGYRESSIEYFIRHSEARKVMFHGWRLQDLGIHFQNENTMVSLAFKSQDVQVLLFLFRHGARVGTDETIFGDATELMDETEDYIKFLWTTSKDYSTILNPDSLVMPQVEVISPSHVILILNVLFRAICQLRHEEFVITDSENRTVRRSQDIILSLSEEGILPKIKLRCMEPAELKHLCRLRIREQLNNHWALPQGIHQLPLQDQHLKEYLDLLHD